MVHLSCLSFLLFIVPSFITRITKYMSITNLCFGTIGRMTRTSSLSEESSFPYLMPSTARLLLSNLYWHQNSLITNAPLHASPIDWCWFHVPQVSMAIPVILSEMIIVWDTQRSQFWQNWQMSLVLVMCMRSSLLSMITYGIKCAGG